MTCVYKEYKGKIKMVQGQWSQLKMKLLLGCTGLSMNILRAGDKSPVQKRFFENSGGDVLPALRFLGGLYNFCNYVTTCKRATYFTDSELTGYYQKTCGWNSKSQKTKNYITNYARYTTLKKSFLMVYVGTYDCYENIKTKLWSTISILKPWH